MREPGASSGPRRSVAGSLAGQIAVRQVLASAGSMTTLNAADLVIFGVTEAAGSGIGTLGAPWTTMSTISTRSQTWSHAQSSWYQVVSSTGTFNPPRSFTKPWGGRAAPMA